MRRSGRHDRLRVALVADAARLGSGRRSSARSALELRPSRRRTARVGGARTGRGRRLDRRDHRPPAGERRTLGRRSTSTGSPLRDARRRRRLHARRRPRDVSEREELRERVREVDALYRVADAIAPRDEPRRAARRGDRHAARGDRRRPRGRAPLRRADEAMRFRAWRRLSDEYRAAAEGHSPWAADTVDPAAGARRRRGAAGLRRRARAASSVKRASARSPSSRSCTADRLLGKFMLYRDAPHEWSDARGPALPARSRTTSPRRPSARGAQHALRESREQLETIMRTVDEGIIVQSADRPSSSTRTTRAARVIGFEQRRGASSPPTARRCSTRFEILDEDGEPLDRRRRCPAAARSAARRRERVVRYRIRATGEERWSVVRANPVHGADGGVELVGERHPRHHGRAKLAEPSASASSRARASC